MITVLHAASHSPARLYYQQIVNLKNPMDAEKFNNHTTSKSLISV